MQENQSTMLKGSLGTPVRNRYFYGKLLDVYHFDLETSYFNAKRWLLNRLISGFGVVCGLNVEPGPEPNQIYIGPGLAIDRWGREIVVEKRSGPFTIPDQLLYHPPRSQPASAGQQSQKGPEHDEIWVQVLICYHECASDPVPIMAGDCNGTQQCAAGTIREQFRLEFREGRAPMPDPECRVPRIFAGGEIDYAALAHMVTENCPDLPHNSCIRLANIHIEEEGSGHRCHPENIDITVRPIVYTNDLLFELLLALGAEEEGAQDYRGRKG